MLVNARLYLLRQNFPFCPQGNDEGGISLVVRIAVPALCFLLLYSIQTGTAAVNKPFWLR